MQTPSSVDPVSLGFAEHTASSHWLGAVAAPRRAQTPPGHSEFAEQGVPFFVPPTQRRPPHVVAPTAAQSASVWHSVAAALLQVSHWHFMPVNPCAEQFGLVASSVRLCVPVVSVSANGNGSELSRVDNADGGQSRLTSSPYAALVPWTVHGWPLRSPPIHAPATQLGHGWSNPLAARNAAKPIVIASDRSPVSLSIVPVTGAATSYRAHNANPAF